uniref:Cyclic nucleotide-binding domain-containing protein n=1 Tax=Haptolina brevifila TaxID=156173 RepID=A0A7S2C904_9EUKA|mmetsp:Transcript_2194/g.4491  ORF Transcript_2194/g.4491 Transcript_2194/m.4491 type:complete len:193 (+) Transcript_2194:1057-1635(+)
MPISIGLTSLHAAEEEQRYERDTIAWAGPCKLLRFCVADVEALIGHGLQLELLKARHRSLLSAVTLREASILQGLPDKDAEWLAMAAVAKRFAPGTMVLNIGDIDEALYVITSGEVAMVAEGLHEDERPRMKVGAYFGELCLTGRKHKRSAAVMVTGDHPVELLYLSQQVLLSNLGLQVNQGAGMGVKWVRK